MLPTRWETHSEDRRLRVARMGTGSPVILLHGYPENLQIWCRLAPLLAERHEVIAFDWPGMGYSDAWRGGATPLHQAQRLRVLMERWGIQRAGLVGLDMGSQPALVFAEHFAEHVASLVVMNSLVFGDERTSWEIRVLRRFGWNRFILSHLPGILFQRAERTFLPASLHLNAALRSDFRQSFRRPEVRAFIIRLCAGYQGMLPRLPEIYQRIAVPTLVLWGECDAHFPPRHAERLHETVAGSKLQIMEGAHHWMPWHDADRVADAILRFHASPDDSPP